MRRREFLAAAAAPIALAYLDAAGRVRAAAAGEGHAEWRPSAVLALTPTNTVIVRIPKSEMGQGVTTALAMLIADELELSLAAIQVELAPGSQEFRDARAQQATGYSSSVASSWGPYRQLAAAVRAKLIAAAASHWQVDRSEIALREGFAVAGERRASFAALAPQARRVNLDAPAVPKPMQECRLIGRPVRRIDTPAKVDGTAKFGIDVVVPNMRIAVIARCPVFGGRMRAFDALTAKRVPGVLDVRAVSSGVAVIARDTYSALRGRDALQVRWDPGPNAQRDSAEHRASLSAALEVSDYSAMEPERVDRKSSDARAAAAGEARKLAADYHVPFLAHAALEPLCAVASVTRERCELWIGTQAPSRAQQWGARLTGLREEQIVVHNYFIGGAFGRRGEWDYYCEAIELSQRLGVPIKTIWTRADDLQHDFYRPAAAHRLEAKTDTEARLAELSGRIAAPSIARRRAPELLERDADFLLTQGLSDHPYGFKGSRIGYREVDLGVPVGFWRSVGHSHNCFAIESFIDEMAHAASVDPAEYRLSLLTTEPRMQAVVRRAMHEAAWGEKLAPSHGRGIACAKSYGTYVAQVVEAVVEAGAIRVLRVVCAVDCGIVVNPNIVRQQMESGIVFGLSAALLGEITIEGGAVRETNYHEYRVLRFGEAPPIAVHLIESQEAPSGCGEPATPVVAPAVANAIFAATGRRLRELPLRMEPIKA
jgi:isoquinoline 1-oxidoreductase beta subunit